MHIHLQGRVLAFYLINASAINSIRIYFLHFRPLYKEIVGKWIYHFACHGFAVQLGKAFHIDNSTLKDSCKETGRIRRSGSCRNHGSWPFDNEVNERKNDIQSEFEDKTYSFPFLLYQVMMRMLLHGSCRSHILLCNDVISFAIHKWKQLHQFHEVAAAGTDETDFSFFLIRTI